MAVPSAYFGSTKNVSSAFADIQKAAVPSRFTYEFLNQLGYPSSGDRPIISVLKALSFLDDSGTPGDRYRRFKGGGKVAQTTMAEAMRDAYADVFSVDQNAEKLNHTDLKAVFARLSDKGDAVNAKMASTFKELAKMADFSAAPGDASQSGKGEDQSEERSQEDAGDQGAVGRVVVHHDVHVHLPASTDIAVYDAIFRSLRENLR